MSFTGYESEDEIMNELRKDFKRVQQENVERLEKFKRRIEKREKYVKNLEIINSSLHQAISEEEILNTNELGNAVRNQRNLIITAPTQIGKTGTLISIIKNNPIPFTVSVVSCDNRSDQLKQLSSRMLRAGVINLMLSDVKMTKSGRIGKVSLEEILYHYEETSSITFVLLNNTAQCSKLNLIMKHLMGLDTFIVVKYQVIHDEADLIHKADEDSVIVPEKVPKVHNDWIDHFNYIKIVKSLRYVKRIWISATPENCSLIKDVKARDVFVLPRDYTKYRAQNKFFEWSTGDNTALVREVERIKRLGSKEVILYCTEHLNVAQKEKSLELLSVANCPVVAYNGTGNTVFRPRCKQEHTKNVPISTILAELEENYTGPVIVVGFALMSRGISFVSSTICEKPLSATVMFYEGSNTTHAVNIAQRIGRITGNSRFDIKFRRLYCSAAIHDCYRKYMENQTAIYLTLAKPENEHRLVADIFQEGIPDMVELGRALDRKELKKANTSYTTGASPRKTDSSVGSCDDDEDKMKRLVRSWMKPGAKSDISKIFRAIYASPGSKMLSVDVKNMVEDLARAASFFGNLTELTHSSKWYLVFSKNQEFHFIKPEALAFAGSLN